MTKIGYTLYCEGNDPRSLVEQAIMAEEAGFDFLAISDHYHPWLPEQQHSAFAWSVLGAVAQATKTIELATMVTCPIVRYHPVIVAQMAATVGVLSGGRFTLGLGAGERLNEHVVGAGWPAVHIRHAMLAEAIDIMQALWSGKYVSYEGSYFSVEDAKVFDLPKDPLSIFVAASGPSSTRLAAAKADGICVSDADKNMVNTYVKNGGEEQAVWAQVVLAWGDNKQKAAQELYDNFRFSVAGWKVQAELPNPVNFAAATSMIKPEDMQADAGPDAGVHIQKAQKYLEAGITHLALAYPGKDYRGFMDMWSSELKAELAQ